MFNLTDELSAIHQAYYADEKLLLKQLLQQIRLTQGEIQQISSISRRLIGKIRQLHVSNTLNELLQEYQLSTDEGLGLMCLAEALLRIPDEAVAQQLISNRIGVGKWRNHLDHGHSLLINASTALLMLTGKVMKSGDSRQQRRWRKLVRRVAKPVVHQSMLKVVRTIARQFVFAQTMHDALEAITGNTNSQQVYSLDMLGEAALTAADAEHFLQKYLDAIEQLGKAQVTDANISIKLSALYPRYEVRHQQQAAAVLVQRLSLLVNAAATYRIGITLDAEESERLQLSLQVFTDVFAQCGDDYTGLGLAVQAYSKRALPVLTYLQALARQSGRKIPVRLVKGAYWDSEIKQAQMAGLPDYPVFTEKNHTDISYLACAHFMLADTEAFYPQFATHNISTIAHILYIAGGADFEFQRLHGMGEELYHGILTESPQSRCRVYCPVGPHKDLLAYLVRRILENGANNSFLKQLMDEQSVDERLALHPIDLLDSPGIFNLPLPQNLYQPERKNAAGLNLAHPVEREKLQQAFAQYRCQQWQAGPPSGISQALSSYPVSNPYNLQPIGSCSYADAAVALQALSTASQAFSRWQQTTVQVRYECLQRFADLLEQARYEMITLLVMEAGKTFQDAIDEVREAVDFARYYASQAQKLMAKPETLSGPVGEVNQLYLSGRGVFLCISPWNFPLAIFAGQVVAALVTGNCVLAKPAEATPLIAAKAVGLLYEAGIPEDVLQLLPGSGDEIGAALCADHRLAGVAFTGSTAAARIIHQRLAAREGSIATLIAETGGQNAMLADSSALPEQLVKDVIQSAFYSAGQRCSALRVLYLQQDIFEPVISLLKGAMDTLVLGDPSQLATDIGPVINSEARQKLEAHIAEMSRSAKLLYACPLPEDLPAQTMVAPHVFQIQSIRQLSEEHFGPILHVIPFAYADLQRCIDEINGCGYGLTLGIHSRNEQWALRLAQQMHVGNIYINRPMTGAVVGVQPFGGQGLSGTGPKAGGPHYLQRFVTEVSISNNTAAVGGNVSLVSRH